MSKTSPPASTRVRRLLVWCAVGLTSLVLLALAGMAVFMWTTDAGLARRTAAIRQAGDPLTLADLARKPIPSEQNAAVPLRRAEKAIASIAGMTSRLPPASQKPAPPISPEDQKTIKKALDAFPEAIALINEAATCADYEPPLNYRVSPQEFMAQVTGRLPQYQVIADVLQRRARLLSAEGNQDEAVRTGLLLLRLARHFDRAPLTISYVPSLAIRRVAVATISDALRAGPVSDDVRRALDAELAQQDPMHGYAWSLKSDRAFTLTARGVLPNRNLRLIQSGLWNWETSDYLDTLAVFLDLAEHSQSYFQGVQTLGQTLSDKQSDPLVQALGATYQRMIGAQAQMRALRVLNALQARETPEAQRVVDVTKLGLPPEAVVDPFNGELLHAKRLPDGWLVYSVGPNLVDDDGDIYRWPKGDVGLGPQSKAETAEKPPAEKP